MKEWKYGGNVGLSTSIPIKDKIKYDGYIESDVIRVRN